MNIQKYPIKKILIIIFAVLIIAYVIWDISVKLVNYLRLQGYEIAIMEMVREAENKECAPFGIFVEDKTINLINIDCLETADNTQEFDDEL